MALVTRTVALALQQAGVIPGQGGDGGQGGARGRVHGSWRKIDTKMMRIRDFSCETAQWEALGALLQERHQVGVPCGIADDGGGGEVVLRRNGRHPR